MCNVGCGFRLLPQALDRIFRRSPDKVPPVELGRMRAGGFRSAFTLAELLIALAILGVIATFTIPKVLLNQQDGRHKAVAKEAIGAISGAYDAYRLNNTVTASFQPADLLPYLNYVRVETGIQIDDRPNKGVSENCTSGSPCYMLHSGAALYLWNNQQCLGGTGGNHLVWVAIDPDGRFTNGPGHAGKALHVALYATGRIATAATITPGSITDWPCGSPAPDSPDPLGDPDWFSWN